MRSERPCVHGPLLFGLTDAVPPFYQRGVDAELIENLGSRMVDQVGDRLRADIKGGNGRQDHGPGLGHLRHQTQMPEVKGRLADHHHKFATFLQTNVGGPGDQICVVGAGYRTEGFDRARCDHHSCGQVGTGSNRRTDIALLVNHVGHFQYLVHRIVSLEFDRGSGALGDDQVSFNIGRLAEDLDQPDPIDGSAGTRDRDDDPFRGYLLGSRGSVLRGRASRSGAA